MDMLRTVVSVIFIILCVALTAIIISQEGKSAGLTGSINGVADTYWGKNKGRSMEGKLVKWTKILAALFFIMTIALNMNW